MLCCKCSLLNGDSFIYSNMHSLTGNTGQVCLCPDYILVEESVKEEFTNELCKVMDQMYPVSLYTNNDGSGSVGKMISVQHAERVVGLLDST